MFDQETWANDVQNKFTAFAEVLAEYTKSERTDIKPLLDQITLCVSSLLSMLPRQLRVPIFMAALGMAAKEDKRGDAKYNG